MFDHATNQHVFPIKFLSGAGYNLPALVIDTAVYDKDNDECKDRHPFKIDLAEPGIRIVFGEDGPATNPDSPNVVIERHKDGSYLMIVHPDNADPVCQIRFRSTEVVIESIGGEEIHRHEITR